MLAPWAQRRDAVYVCGRIEQDHARMLRQRTLVPDERGSLFAMVPTRDERALVCGNVLASEFLLRRERLAALAPLLSASDLPPSRGKDLPP
jgi:hypothetical protein